MDISVEEARIRQVLVTASKAMLTAAGEIEWLHPRARLAERECGALLLLRTSIDEITDLLHERFPKQ